MEIFDWGNAFLSLYELGNQFHRARTIERDQRYDIVQFGDIELLGEACHASGFHLKKPDRLASIVEAEGRRIVEWNIFQREIRLPLANQTERILDDGERLQPEEIYLEQTEIVQWSHWILADHVVAFYVASEGNVVGQIPISDDNSGRVDAGITGQTLQNLCVLKELTRSRLGRDGSFQLRILFNGRLESNIQFVRNHLRDAIGVAIAQSHNASDIAHDAFCFQFSKRDDLRDAAFAVLLAHIFQHLAAARFAKIDIYIRWRNAVRI